MKHKVLSREEWKAEYQARLHGQHSIENVEAPKPQNVEVKAKNKEVKESKSKSKSKNTVKEVDSKTDDKK